MPTNLHILCPGQGAQFVGMGKALTESPAAREVFEIANKTLGFDLMAICFGGPEEEVNRTDICQPGIFAVSVASFRNAIERGQFDVAAVTSFAGLSLGEYTALHLAGVFGLEEGLKLVHARGTFMQEAAKKTPGSMVALIGADEKTAKELCEKSAVDEVLSLANFNAPGQIVVSGSKDACARVLAAAEAAGIRATELKVAGAFHSSLMQSAADRMKEELAKVNFASPRKPVYSNVTAQVHTTPESIKQLLVRQIVEPVRWEQTMQPLAADGSAKFIELSPGRVLATLAKRINRRLPVESLG